MHNERLWVLACLGSYVLHRALNLRLEREGGPRKCAWRVCFEAIVRRIMRSLARNPVEGGP